MPVSASPQCRPAPIPGSPEPPIITPTIPSLNHTHPIFRHQKMTDTTDLTKLLVHCGLRQNLLCSKIMMFIFDSYIQGFKIMFWNKLPPENRTRFKIISFAFLPALFLLGFIISTFFAKKIFQDSLDSRGATLVLAFLFILYIRCVFAVYKKLK
jgi:hypothetical protein